MTRRATILVLVTFFCLAGFNLAGCGQKGPLKLPEAVEPEPAQTGQTENEQE